MRVRAATWSIAAGIALTGVALLLIACADSSEPENADATPGPTLGAVATTAAGPSATPVDPSLVDVQIGDLTIKAEVAQTPEERTQGLSGRESLPENGGMLFVQEQETLPTLWMKEMSFALDFIWISADRRVADLTVDVQPPDPGTEDADLARYQPSEPVLFVLEVNAGTVRQAGIQVGDAVVFQPDVWPEPGQ